MSGSEIVCLRFQDSHGISREADKHHYPPCFRVKVNRRHSRTQLDTVFEICDQNEDELCTLNLFVPGNVNNYYGNQIETISVLNACAYILMQDNCIYMQNDFHRLSVE